MKQILKIIFISLACVIGALGIATGATYLLGGMDKEIIYAKDLAFSQTQIISSETIYLQVNTTTSGVTEKTLKLVPSVGGSDVIEFPETITIGETFTIIPKRVNGVNKGGNVTLTAEYYSSNSDVSVTAKCEILIDIPVEEVSLKVNIDTMSPNQKANIYLKDNEVSSALNIFPSNEKLPISLVPYLSFGTKKIDNIIDKVIFLELVNGSGHKISTNIAQFELDGVPQPDNKIKVAYSYRNTGLGKDKELVFDNELNVLSKETKANIYIKAYVYSTYKEQIKNTFDGEILTNGSSIVSGNTNFKVIDSKIINMNIISTSKNVVFDEAVRIYLNNPNVTGNDINLGVSLQLDSPGIPILDHYILDNIYINFNNSDLFSLANVINQQCTKTTYGYSVKYEGISTQKDEWYWVFKVDDFKAYTNYKNNNQPIVATVTYFDAEEDALYQHSFNIITQIYEADSLNIVYNDNETSFTVRSEETFALTKDNVIVNHSLPSSINPTATGFEYYISYDKNFEKGKTTVSTIPSIRGKYKAVFEFELSNETNSIAFNYANKIITKNVTFIQEDKTYKHTENGEISTNNNLGFTAGKVKAIVELEATDVLTNGTIFTILASKDATSETIVISATKVKFYEKVDANNAESTEYMSLPYLSINEVRYFIDFDFYTDANYSNYLKIKNSTETNAYKVRGIGSFYITVQYVYNDYWLGLSAHAKVDVYQELSNLDVYSFNHDTYSVFNTLENYSTEDNSLKFMESDSSKHYIFIKSDNEMQALTNYVNYNQINIAFTQDFGEYANYNGIRDINKQAISFGTTWNAVTDANGNVIGFVNYYEINPIYSISINGTDFIKNKFDIKIWVNVDFSQINANFKISTNTEEVKNSLTVDIEDEIITSTYLGIGDSEEYTKNNPLSIYASLNEEGEVTWSTDLNTVLEYHFVYSNNNLENTIDTMIYDLNCVDNSKINPNYLSTFELSENGGGLNLQNFPVYLNESNVNQGVLVELIVKTLGMDSPVGIIDINSHYKWNGETFKQRVNNNLQASMFIKIFGLNISLTSNDIDIVGYKDKEVSLFGDNALFKMSVKSGDGKTDLTSKITDYTKFMTASINSLYARFKQDDNTTIVLTKDFIREEDIQSIFYIGTNANKVNIIVGKNDDGTDKIDTKYIQKILPAFTLTTTQSFIAPSVENTFFELSYGNGETTLPASMQVLVEVVSNTLPSSDKVSNPISIENNKLKFKTVTSTYTAVIKLTIINSETSERWEQQYTILVNSKYSSNDLTVGTKVGDDYTILAGLNGGAAITFSEELNKVKSNIESYEVLFENVDSSDLLLASNHMDCTSDYVIRSDDLNYDKFITATLEFNFKDNGGKLIVNKTLKILKNLQITLINNTFGSSSNNSLILTDETKYNFVNLSNIESILDFSLFEYDNENAEYNKDSFEIGNYFEDISSEYDNFIIEVKQNSSLEGLTINTYISFKYKTTYKYELTFVFPVKIVYYKTVNTQDSIVLGSQDNDDNAYINSGKNNLISTSNGIEFKGYIAQQISNISNIVITFIDNSTNEECEDMNYSFDSSTKKVEIWSNVVSNGYSVNITFSFELNDGTKIECIKALNVLA